MVKTVFTQGELVASTGIAWSQQLEKSGCCNQESYVQLIIRSAERAKLVYMHVLHARSESFYRSDCAVQCLSFFSSFTQIS